jgi:hypothetical protein
LSNPHATKFAFSLTHGYQQSPEKFLHLQEAVGEWLSWWLAVACFSRLLFICTLAG